MDSRWTGAEWGPARIAGVYIALSAGWIFGSDWVIHQVVTAPEQVTAFQTLKGSVFIAVSGLVIFALVRRDQRRLAAANADLERTLKHASVLHRLLRHNLRNSCDVVQNTVDLLRTGRGDPAENRDRIERQATRLATIAEKCQHLRDVVFDEDLEAQKLDLVTVVTEAVECVREEHADATLTVETPEELAVVAHPRIEVAIRELVANAVRHAGSEGASVGVAVERNDDEAVVRVTDDGPGLPTVEREVLEAGDEHTLAHSRGIGVWMVRFIVLDSGGSVSVETPDAGGTTVALSLKTAV